MGIHLFKRGVISLSETHHESRVNIAFNSRRSNFPVLVFGIESMKTTPPFSLL